MRPQEILEAIDAAAIDTPTIHFFPQTGALRNLAALRTKIEALEPVPGFVDFQAALRTSHIFKTLAGERDIDSNEWQALQRMFVEYVVQMKGLRAYLKTVVDQQESDAVYVKLPEAATFREIIELQDRLEKAMSQLVLLPPVQGNLAVKQWETGSLWMRITVGSALAVAVVGTAAWSAAVVYKKTQEGRLHAQYVENLKLKGEMIAALADAQKAMLAHLVDAEARALDAAHLNGATPPEDIERVKHAIREIAGLIEKGAEIHPALQAPEDVKNLFPDFKNLMQIESRTRLLTEGRGPQGAAGN